MPKADRNVHWSPAARQDVRRIWRHYAQVASREVADKLLHDLTQAGERTATLPLLWRARDDIRPGLRALRVGAYFVFYRLVKDGTEIVRILHGRRNLKAAFRDRKH